jgi:hypothetical protein
MSEMISRFGFSDNEFFDSRDFGFSLRRPALGAASQLLTAPVLSENLPFPTAVRLASGLVSGLSMDADRADSRDQFLS